MDSNVNPIVSVIMPVYNGEKYIAESIQSVINQSYIFWELIVIDDGSNDFTYAKIKPFLIDNRIKYFYKKNEGQSVARNYGIINAVGIYIAFLDSDDLWHSDKLRFQLDFLLVNNYKFVFCNFYIIDKESKIVGEILFDSKDNISKEKLLLFKDYIGTLTVIFKRTLIDEVGFFDEMLNSAEDWDYWIRISTQFKLGFLNKSLAYYRQHIDGISKNMKVQLNQELLVLKKHILNSSILDKAEKEIILWNHYKSMFQLSLKVSELKYVLISLNYMLRFDLVKTIKLLMKLFILQINKIR